MKVTRHNEIQGLSTAVTIVIIIVVLFGSIATILVIPHYLRPPREAPKVMEMDGGLSHWTNQVVFVVYNNGTIPVTGNGRVAILSYRAQLNSVMDVGGGLTNNGTVGVTPLMPTITCVESDVENSSYSPQYASSATVPLEGFHFGKVSCLQDLSLSTLNDWVPTFLSPNQSERYSLQITVTSTSFSPHAMLVSWVDYFPKN